MKESPWRLTKFICGFRKCHSVCSNIWEVSFVTTFLILMLLTVVLKDVRAHCYCARYTWHGTCHVMYFKRAHRVETQQNIELMTFAVTWSAYIFVGCLVTPTFFFQQITSFSDSFHYTKKQKNLYAGSFNYFPYTIQIGSNWYMDTSVRDLEVAFFKG